MDSIFDEIKMEVGEVSKEALENHFSGYYKNAGRLTNYRKELVQVAAVAVAMIECLDRNDNDGFPEKPNIRS
ncbi:hypothetical protein [Williamwhitmania taraxaci]|uniref:Uncharacterized protein n=1 Tax=Williamwhitmania taraxaci TaxID=1640674 RepID=A0A1G6MEG5_9BACT|nr:hypothetical protein [Williamwhitmania taraxaci]SDC53355.1 hypothetical protein SAMN05216323_103541 [Williamwhitmania taraxaci]